MLDGKKEMTIALYKNLRELLGHIRKRKRSYFGHLCRAHGWQITKAVVVVGRTSKTRKVTKTVGLHGQHQAVDKTTISQCVRAAEDRSRWKEFVSQVMLANNQT